MKYFVSRQIYWPDGTKMVEIAKGGLDYANAGMLVPKFRSLGEGQEFTDPREAVEAAIQIYYVWLKTESDVQIGHGCTGGFSMPFDSDTIEAIQAWAEKEAEALPKCAHCGDILPKRHFTHDMADDDKFCSENCADNNYQSIITVDDCNEMYAE